MLYTYNCITLLYSRSEHNIVSQLYFNQKKIWLLQLHPCNLATLLRKDCELEKRETPQISLVCVYIQSYICIYVILFNLCKNSLRLIFL